MRLHTVWFACLSLVGHAAWSAVPDAQIVQRAYEAVRNDADSNPRHVYELTILNARCTPQSGADNYVCQIDFVRKDKPDGRLYFEVVTVAARPTGWVLLSGLCKTRPAGAASQATTTPAQPR